MIRAHEDNRSRNTVRDVSFFDLSCGDLERHQAAEGNCALRSREAPDAVGACYGRAPAEAGRAIHANVA